MDFKDHLEAFVELLDNLHVVKFLKRDTCGALCDKYHLAIVFQFFIKADFTKDEYTAENFFLALALSHDLYDECHFLKRIISDYYLSCSDGIKYPSKVDYQREKGLLFKKMQFRGFIERKVCQKLCMMIRHKALDKRRKKMHTGILSLSALCSKCNCPISKTEVNIINSDTTDNKNQLADNTNISDFITIQGSKKRSSEIKPETNDIFLSPFKRARIPLG